MFEKKIWKKRTIAVLYAKQQGRDMRWTGDANNQTAEPKISIDLLSCPPIDRTSYSSTDLLNIAVDRTPGIRMKRKALAMREYKFEFFSTMVTKFQEKR